MRCSLHQENEAISVCVFCGAAVCSQCQRLALGRAFCVTCYAELEKSINPNAKQQAAISRPLYRKSSFLAFLLGLIPGVGHLYLGQMQKGLVLMGIVAVLSYLSYALPPIPFLIPILIAYSAFDSVHTANRLNAGEPIQDWGVSGVVRQYWGIDPSWSFFVGAGLVILGGLLLIGSLGQLTGWFWQLPHAWRVIGRNLIAVLMLAGGGYLLWRTFRSSS